MYPQITQITLPNWSYLLKIRGKQRQFPLSLAVDVEHFKILSLLLEATLRTCYEINFTILLAVSLLSFRSYSSLLKQLHSAAMRMFYQLDYERKSCAIFVNFISAQVLNTEQHYLFLSSFTKPHLAQVKDTTFKEIIIAHSRIF